MVNYLIKFTPFFENQLRKLKKKDKVLFARLIKKLKELRKNPEHYKPLKKVLKGTRRAHLGHFILIFEVQGNLIIVHYLKHHNQAY